MVCALQHCRIAVDGECNFARSARTHGSSSRDRSTSMPEPAYMTVKGKAQGDISSGALGTDSMGRDSKSSHENEILVQAYKHSIMTPKDPLTGQPRGKPVHEYFTVTKPQDKSSALLY